MKYLMTILRGTDMGRRVWMGRMKPAMSQTTRTTMAWRSYSFSMMLVRNSLMSKTC